MKSSKLIAIIVAVMAAIWIFSGFLDGDEPVDVMPVAQNEQIDSQIMDVRVREMKAEPYSDDVVITGRTQASKTVELKAEIEGQLQNLLKEEGAVIKAGEVLAELELRDRAVRRSEAKQKLRQRQIEYNAAKKLEGKGFNSKVKLAQTQADLATATADLKLAEIELSKTKITAPFDGVIYQQAVEEGDYLSNGDPLLTVVDLDPIEFVGFVSERNIQNMALGKEARAAFLNGEVITGTLSYIAPAADQQTRTFRIIVSAENTDFKIKEGLTAKIAVPLADKKAHKISPAILSLNDAGELGVKIVTDEHKVRFMPVKILSDEPKAMWISGLPDIVKVITVGQDFVIDGQRVNPVLSEGDGLL